MEPARNKVFNSVFQREMSLLEKNEDHLKKIDFVTPIIHKALLWHSRDITPKKETAAQVIFLNRLVPNGMKVCETCLQEIWQNLIDHKFRRIPKLVALQIAALISHYAFLAIHVNQREALISLRVAYIIFAFATVKCEYDINFIRGLELNNYTKYENVIDKCYQDIKFKVHSYDLFEKEFDINQHQIYRKYLRYCTRIFLILMYTRINRHDAMDKFETDLFSSLGNHSEGIISWFSRDAILPPKNLRMVHIKKSYEDSEIFENEFLLLNETQKAIFIEIFNDVYQMHEEVWPLNMMRFQVYYKRFVSYLKLIINRPPLEQLGITKNIAHDFLTVIKLYDLAQIFYSKLQFSYMTDPFKISFRLRDHIFRICSPSMQSFVAFTKSCHAGKIQDRSYWLDPRNWVSERAAMTAKICAEHMTLVRSLSDRLQPPVFKHAIIATRGNSGSGKSTYLKEILKSCLEYKEGVLNPDIIKAKLKEKFFQNHQIHDEGSAVFKVYFRTIAKKNEFNYIIDTRLSTVKNLQEYVIEPAYARNCTAKVVDFDIPLSESLINVLMRDPFGEDPCPVLTTIVDGFIENRKNRKEMIEVIMRESKVSEYELRDGSSNTVVAQKQGNTFIKHNEDKYLECLQAPTEEDIQKTLYMKIDEEFIKKYPWAHEPLTKYKNCLLGGAVNAHAGIKSS